MSEQVLSIEEVEASAYAAMRAAEHAPVLIQEGGRLAYALVSYNEYISLKAQVSSQVLRLGQPPTD
jgi:hypothetical protein